MTLITFKTCVQRVYKDLFFPHYKFGLIKREVAKVKMATPVLLFHGTVLVCLYCHDRIPQNGWLKPGVTSPWAVDQYCSIAF